MNDPNLRFLLIIARDGLFYSRNIQRLPPRAAAGPAQHSSLHGGRILEILMPAYHRAAIDKEMLKSIVDDCEKVMAEGENPKKKHLLHQLVKKVLIHNRQTVEIW